MEANRHLYEKALADAPDEERWVPAFGYETIYEVSNHGRVRAYHASGNRWKAGRLLAVRMGYNYHHYPWVMLHKEGVQRTRILHLLVAQSFLGPKPKGMHCAHKDGCKYNPRLDNLAYVTPQENADHKELHGTVMRGERHCAAKLTEADVHDIDVLYDLFGMKVRAIAEIYGLHQASVNAVCQRINWRRTPKLTYAQGASSHLSAQTFKVGS